MCYYLRYATAADPPTTDGHHMVTVINMKIHDKGGDDRETGHQQHSANETGLFAVWKLTIYVGALLWPLLLRKLTRD